MGSKDLLDCLRRGNKYPKAIEYPSVDHGGLARR